jgi:hypothetical protein
MSTPKNKIQKDLFKEMGLDGLPEEKKTELMMKWGEIVQKDVVIRVVREMSEENKEELDKMLAENKSWDEIYEFLEDKFDDLDDIVKEETTKFQKELVENAQELGFDKEQQ